jgi:hypothetical protein
VQKQYSALIKRYDFTWKRSWFLADTAPQTTAPSVFRTVKDVHEGTCASLGTTLASDALAQFRNVIHDESRFSGDAHEYIKFDTLEWDRRLRSTYSRAFVQEAQGRTRRYQGALVSEELSGRQARTYRY